MPICFYITFPVFAGISTNSTISYLLSLGHVFGYTSCSCLQFQPIFLLHRHLLQLQAEDWEVFHINSYLSLSSLAGMYIPRHSVSKGLWQFPLYCSLGTESGHRPLFPRALRHTIFHTHTTLSHTTLSHTHNFITHNFVTHNFVTHHLSHTQLCHIQLSHTTLSQTTCSHTTCSHLVASTTTLCGRCGTWRHRHFFAWQACHLATSTVTLRGRCGASRHPPSFCVAGVALLALGWL